MLFIIVAVILGIIAGLGKGIRDTLAHHYENSIFSRYNPNFWNPTLSGSNKWKNGDRKQGERFFLSSTLLVVLTEGWHIGEFINVLFIICSTSLFTIQFGLIGVIISRVVYGLSFTLFYHIFDKR
jgi:hypothetical protein